MEQPHGSKTERKSVNDECQITAQCCQSQRDHLPLIEREQHQSCGDKSDCIRKTHGSTRVPLPSPMGLIENRQIVRQHLRAVTPPVGTSSGTPVARSNPRTCHGPCPILSTRLPDKSQTRHRPWSSGECHLGCPTIIDGFASNWDSFRFSRSHDGAMPRQTTRGPRCEARRRACPAAAPRV